MIVLETPKLHRSLHHDEISPSPKRTGLARARRLAPALLATALAASAVTAIGAAPTELTMGHAQRVVYVHVAVAWIALLSYLYVAGAGLFYLLRRDLRWDHGAAAAGEVGWIAATLTLATGSLWARSAWGTWWTWDPRLVTAFVLWSLYGGYLLLRRGLDDPHARARAGAVLALVGVADVPLVIMATRWFRTIHPTSPELEPAMRWALVLAGIALGAFATLLVRARASQLALEARLSQLERSLAVD
jgi:heme exporter protein C